MKQIVTVELNGVPISTEVDTGSPVILISLATYKKYFKSIKLTPYIRHLYTADNRELKIAGSFMSKIAFKDKIGEVEVVVSAETLTFPLLGEPALDVIFPEWRKTFSINSLSNDSNKFSELINLKYPTLFDNNLLTPIKNFVIDLRVKEGTTPVFAGARAVPHAIRHKVEKSLWGMVDKGILKPVKSSNWASPLVVVHKSDDSLRICIDPKRTLNPCLVDDFYPIPCVEDLFVEIGGHELYSVIDLTGAFQQLKLSDKSSELVTINTHVGLFQFLRLPFGIKVASAAFQRVIDQILKQFPWAKAYIDDIIVTAHSRAEMEDRLGKLFDALHKCGAKVNLHKCKFFERRIEFLGHVVSREGVFASEKKIEAVVQAKRPQNVKELQSFIGLVTYLHRFVPRLSEKLNPLFELLIKNKQFIWKESQQQSFQAIKDEIAKGKFLTHFSQEKDLKLCTDACDIGIAAVLCHEDDKGLLPIVFKSRTLSDAEKKYPILHKELLAVVYAVEKFYKYIYGRKIVLYTDHQPLVSIIKAGLALPTAVTRVQRYLLRLNPYDLFPIYKPGKLNVLADFASRFPMAESQSDADRDEERRTVRVNCITDAQCVNLAKIKLATKNDDLLIKLKECMLTGFPKKKLSPELRPFLAIRSQLDNFDDVLLCESRVIVPAALRPAVLKMLHEHHLGVVRSKQLARKYFYWPGLNNELEKMVRACKTCMEVDADRLPKVFVPWPAPTRPFERVHLDFFDALSRRFLLLVDAFSRWTEIFPMQKTDASHVVAILRKIFLTFGNPILIVTDNGPPFSSKEFHEFCTSSSIKLIKSPPYHPASNGICERWVQSSKILFKKIMGSTYSENKLFHVLEALRTSPTTEGIIPSHVIFSYRRRTKLEDCLPKIQGEEVNHDVLPPWREFAPGEKAWLTSKGGPRVPCEIVLKKGHVLYSVVAQGVERTVHANQLKKCADAISDETANPKSTNCTVAVQNSRPQRKRRPPIRFAT